jgi:hypothetical protein
LLFVRSRISPLRAAPRPFGRDDKGAISKNNWYNKRFMGGFVDYVIFNGGRNMKTPKLLTSMFILACVYPTAPGENIEIRILLC